MERLTEYIDEQAIPRMSLRKNGYKKCTNKLAKYEDTGLTPEECMNYKQFEDECIRDGVQFKDILKLKDILKGMTCETCRDHGKCAIYDNFNIKYCSDWVRKDG